MEGQLMGMKLQRSNYQKKEVAEELVNRGIYDFYGYSRLKSFSVVNKSRFEFECLDFDRNYFLVLSFYIFAFTILKETNYQTDLIFL